MLTIGELAQYAGVTVRTVRHYHQVGLLPEPGRDELGHRRYDAATLLRMMRLVALTDAGVPLKRIPQVLQAEPAQRAAVLDELDQELLRRQERLARTRERLAHLRTDEDLSLPPGLVELGHRLLELGVEEEQVAQEREVWLLSSALYPELTAQWIAEQRQLLDDAEYAALYLETSRTADWSPEDPRLTALAERNVAWTVAHLDDYQSWKSSYEQDPRAARLMEAHYAKRFQSPAHRRFQQLVQQGLRRELDQMPNEKAASRSALA